MSRYNKKLIDVMDKILLEEHEVVNLVGPKHYEWFVGISDKLMEIIIQLILKYWVNQFNRKLASEEIEDDEDVFEFFALWLELIAEGRVAFSEEDMKLVFFKPIGPPPTEELRSRIENKIKNFEPVIKKVIWSCKRMEESDADYKLRMGSVLPPTE